MKSLFLVLLLVGCCADPIIPEPRVIKETSYVVRIPPKDLMTVPDKVNKINVETATQADVAKFILDQYERMQKLENRVIEISKFLVDEQQKLDAKAKEENLANCKEALTK